MGAEGARQLCSISQAKGQGLYTILSAFFEYLFIVCRLSRAKSIIDLAFFNLPVN